MKLRRNDLFSCRALKLSKTSEAEVKSTPSKSLRADIALSNIGPPRTMGVIGLGAAIEAELATPTMNPGVWDRVRLKFSLHPDMVSLFTSTVRVASIE